jgi:hypothetical protein
VQLAFALMYTVIALAVLLSAAWLGSISPTGWSRRSGA